MTDHKHDIEKYLSGKLTAAEMHALEKKALTDPFLADALEGGESIRADEWSADLIDIRKALDQRIEKEERHISPWTWAMRIAAGLLFLAISTYLIISLTSEKPKSDLALNEQEKKETTITRNQPEISADKATTEAESNEVTQDAITVTPQKPKLQSHPNNDYAKPEIYKDENLALAEEDAEITDAKIDALDSYSKLDSVVVQPARSFDKSLPSVTSSSETAKRKEPNIAGASRKMETLAGRSSVQTNVKTIKGKVTDAEDGTALPGVNVTIKDTNVGTVTDAEGNFEIPQADPNSELVFSFIGLQNVEVPVNNEENLDVKMSADFSELSEIVVVGYAAHEPGVIKESQPNSYFLAEPKGGRKAYKKYLAQNVSYPQQALENKIEGKVTVQFMVEPSGLINEFKVIRSLGYGCDEEVIRLIKNGPKWAPSKLNDIPMKAKVKVRMRFTLPH
jgi:TonB family protein